MAKRNGQEKTRMRAKKKKKSEDGWTDGIKSKKKKIGEEPLQHVMPSRSPTIDAGTFSPIIVDDSIHSLRNILVALLSISAVFQWTILYDTRVNGSMGLLLRLSRMRRFSTGLSSFYILVPLSNKRTPSPSFILLFHLFVFYSDTSSTPFKRQYRLFAPSYNCSFMYRDTEGYRRLHLLVKVFEDQTDVYQPFSFFIFRVSWLSLVAHAFLSIGQSNQGRFMRQATPTALRNGMGYEIDPWAVCA